MASGIAPDLHVSRCCLQGLLRLAGTLMGAAVGIAIYYFAFLCDGLSRNDNPQASFAAS